MSTFAKALAGLEAREIFARRENPPASERTRRALQKLGLLGDADRALVVAGTNGKGSTCAFLEALLEDAGAATGLFTSPHLISPRERIRVRGHDVTEEEFADAYFAIEPAAHGLTHFEVLALMAAWTFARVPLDLRIWEVGLGGKLDATNAIPHRHCAITRLGLDHQEILGRTMGEIAAAKLGIVEAAGPGAQVSHLSFPPEAAKLARGIPAHFREATVYPHETVMQGGHPRTFLLTPWGRAELGLLGGRAAENASLALAILASLGYDPRDRLGALGRVRWPGRMERLEAPHAPCPVYVSGDHNAQGIQSLLELLPAFPRTHLHVIAGIGAAREPELLAPLFALADTSVYLTELPFRGRKLADYGEWGARARGAWRDPVEALAQVARLARPGELIVVTGSLYLVGAVSR